MVQNMWIPSKIYIFRVTAAITFLHMRIILENAKHLEHLKHMSLLEN